MSEDRKTLSIGNMEIYDAVRSVPDSAKREFDRDGFHGTAINPMYVIQTLTRQFGPAGFGWTVECLRKWTETSADGTVSVYVDVNLSVKVDGEWSRPIFGHGGNSMTRMKDEAYKCAYTDAIGVAAKALGVGADVYYEASETKYRPFYKEKAAERETHAGGPLGTVREPDLFSQVSSELSSTLDELLGRMQSRFNITRTNWQRLVKASGRSSETHRLPPKPSSEQMELGHHLEPVEDAADPLLRVRVVARLARDAPPDRASAGMEVRPRLPACLQVRASR